MTAIEAREITNKHRPHRFVELIKNEAEKGLAYLSVELLSEEDKVWLTENGYTFNFWTYDSRMSNSPSCWTIFW